MERVYNISAGPSMLPVSVLETAASEMLNYKGSGMSVMEMSHRSSDYDAIIKAAEANLRKLMNIPDNYKVLFLQGGASTQFAAVPLNLMNKNKKADYIVSGQFSGKAFKEAQKYGDAVCVATSKEDNFVYIPETTRESFRPDADYVHVCFNNTIYGTKFNYIPDTGDIPLVADMSSCIISEPVDVSKFGVIYAGAQKNMAPAGLTVVIIREDLLGNAREDIPTMLDYKTHVSKGSMFNTPPVVPIYCAMQTLRWIKQEGGVAEMARRAEERAALLYAEIDRNKLFRGTAREDSRSLMNICFVMNDEYKELEQEFLQYAQQQGIVGIKGHRDVGGFRASCYNAMPLEGVKTLIKVMQDFEAAH